jgi:thiamine kinase-like enzyme
MLALVVSMARALCSQPSCRALVVPLTLLPISRPPLVGPTTATRRRLEKQSMYFHQITAQLGADYPVVFTHGDLAARNILVRDGHIVAILDWEFAGW